MSQFDHVSVVKKANVYWYGGHYVVSYGVIFPSLLTFNTGAPEIMELNAGRCRVRLKGESQWREYGAGERFSVPGNSSFDIETVELLDYVCHFK